MSSIDKDKLKKMLPRGTSHKVTDEIIELINSMEKDTGLLQDYLEESVLTYLPVLREVRVGLREYVNAIKYCNLKRNMTNEKAWQIVFPDRYERLVQEGRWNTSHVSMYNNSPLVVKIDTQMAVAVSIQYSPVFHKQIMKQMQLSDGISSNGMPVSATVQQLASAKLLDVLAPPTEQEINLKIGQSDEAKASQEAMFEEMKRIAENQQKLLAEGHSLEDVQKLNMTIEMIDDDELIDTEEINDD